MDLRAFKLGEIILKYSLDIKKGERLLIMGNEAVMPFMKILYKLAVKYGANPQLQIEFDGLLEWIYKVGSMEQIKYIPPSEIEAMKTVDAVLYVVGDTNTRRFTNVDELKIKERYRSREILSKVFSERIENGEIRICSTLFPTHSNAQEANMSLMEYEDYIYKACKLDEINPIEKWHNMKIEQDRIRKLLNQGDKLRIISRNTDITLSVKGRRWINCLGHENFPGGEIFTSPIETSAEGFVSFSYPLIYEGRKINDVILKFKEGRVVSWGASKGEKLLNELLQMDEGAKLLGEIGIGMNYSINRFVGSMLLDEKIGGTVHLALGKGFRETGGVNKSDIHLDMLLNMFEGGSIFLDDKLIYKDGNFTK